MSPAGSYVPEAQCDCFGEIPGPDVRPQPQIRVPCNILAADIPFPENESAVYFEDDVKAKRAVYFVGGLCSAAYDVNGRRTAC